MYWKHFGLHEDPFSLTADSRFLFLTEAHRDVLETLRESVEAERGFAALIAAPGIGKTTLLYELLEQLRDTAVTAFIFESHFEPIDILRLLLKGLGQDTSKADVISLHQQLGEALGHVAKMGKRFVVVIDEAQALSPAALETVRLLSNFDLNRKKPVQVVLAGQQEFEDLLARPGLQHIKQRIAAYGRLKPFTKHDTHAYVAHRLRVAGGAEPFTPEALDVLAELSHGAARTINIYGFQALHAAIKKGAAKADSEITRQAIHEFEGWPLPVAAPVLERRVVPASPPKSVRPSTEDDDFFETGKDPALQALLKDIRSGREQSRPLPAEPAITPAVPPSPPAFTPAAAKPEPIPFSIAAVIKTTEPAPVAVNRTAAAVAPALEKPEEVTVVAEPAKPVTKAPVLVVSSPVKAMPPDTVTLATPAKANKTTTISVARPPLWRKRQVQLAAAVISVALLLAGGGTWAYKRGWFKGTQTASAAPMDQPAASTAAPSAPVSAGPNTSTAAANEVAHPPLIQPKPEAPRKAAVPAPTVAAAPRVAEIATGKGRRIVESEPAPSAPMSLASSAQPNFGAALTPSPAGVSLEGAKVSDVKPAVVISQPKPIYPEIANRLGVTGVVVLKVQVNAQGKPTKIAVISGHPLLAAAAQSAVLSGWRFSPATLNGKPVESESEVRINFKGSR